MSEYSQQEETIQENNYVYISYLKLFLFKIYIQKIII